MNTDETQRLQEQVAYMEREIEKQREEIRALWEEIAAVQKKLERVLQHLQGEAEEGDPVSG